MDLPLFVVDAFTDRAFAGNPAAVCLLDGPLDDGLRQRIAAEMNLSETAFVEPAPSDDGTPTFRLRWFTPRLEIDLCGHATLASAAVLWRERSLAGDRIRFLSRSGDLLVDRTPGGLRLDFPLERVESCPVPADAAKAIGANVLQAWRGPRSRKVILELESPAEVAGLRPDLGALAACTGIYGLAVTARGGSEGADFTSRYFHPWAGVPEDPVTGSMHTAVGPMWARRLGKTVMEAHQASARGGRLTVEVQGDRVLMTGAAVVVVRGVLTV